MGGPLDTLSEQLTLAREYALLGSYDTALIFFEGVVAQINKYEISTSCLILLFLSASVDVKYRGRIVTPLQFEDFFNHTT